MTALKGRSNKYEYMERDTIRHSHVAYSRSVDYSSTAYYAECGGYMVFSDTCVGDAGKIAERKIVMARHNTEQTCSVFASKFTLEQKVRHKLN